MISLTQRQPAARQAPAVNPSPPGGPDFRPPQLKKKTRRVLVAVLFLAVATLAAIAYISMPASVEIPQVPADVPKPIAVVGLGYLEPVTKIIKLGAPGNPDSQRIGALKVEEGDQVDEGQVVAVLDTAAKLQSQVDASQSLVALKRVQLERQKLDIAAAITAKRSSLERARAELDMTRADFDRQKALSDRGFAAQATFEKKQRELINSQATVREMEAALERIEASVEGVGPEIDRLIDVAVAQKEFEAAESDLQVAKANLDQAMIRAPFAGRVLTVRARTGERIGSDGLLELGATQNMRAVIEVYQTDIPRVRVGQGVTIKSDVLPSPIVGVVERIGSTVKRQSVVNNDPATATDARVIEVFVVFDQAGSRIVAGFSNLQVYGVFEP